MLAKSRRSTGILIDIMNQGCLIRGIIKESATNTYPHLVEITFHAWSSFVDYDGNRFFPGQTYINTVNDGCIQNNTGLTNISITGDYKEIHRKLKKLIKTWQIEHPLWLKETPCVIIYQTLSGEERLVDTTDLHIRDHLNRFLQRLAYETDLSHLDYPSQRNLNTNRRLYGGSKIQEIGGDQGSILQVLMWRVALFLKDTYK